MKKITLRIPPVNVDARGVYLTFIVHADKIEDVSRKIVDMLNENKDKDGAIRVDLSYGLISGRLFIGEQWDVEASIVSVEEDELGAF